MSVARAKGHVRDVHQFELLRHAGQLQLCSLYLYNQPIAIEAANQGWSYFDTVFHVERIQYPLMKDHLSIMTISEIIFDKNVIRETPLWYNPMFRLQIKKEWKDKGIMVISDLLDYMTVPLSLEKINNKFNIKMNFLEYGKIAAIVKNHFEWKKYLIAENHIPEIHI